MSKTRILSPTTTRRLPSGENVAPAVLPGGDEDRRSALQRQKCSLFPLRIPKTPAESSPRVNMVCPLGPNCASRSSCPACVKRAIGTPQRHSMARLSLPAVSTLEPSAENRTETISPVWAASVHWRSLHIAMSRCHSQLLHATGARHIVRDGRGIGVVWLCRVRNHPASRLRSLPLTTPESRESCKRINKSALQNARHEGRRCPPHSPANSSAAARVCGAKWKRRL